MRVCGCVRVVLPAAGLLGVLSFRMDANVPVSDSAGPGSPGGAFDRATRNCPRRVYSGPGDRADGPDSTTTDERLFRDRSGRGGRFRNYYRLEYADYDRGGARGRSGTFGSYFNGWRKAAALMYLTLQGPQNPLNLARQSAFTRFQSSGSGYNTGLGSTCGCGGACCSKGLGFFDTGWDLSGWGWMEWGTVFVGAYILLSVFSTSKRATRRVRRGYRKLRTGGAKRRAEELRREARHLEESVGGGGRRRRGGDFF